VRCAQQPAVDGQEEQGGCARPHLGASWERLDEARSPSGSLSSCLTTRGAGEQSADGPDGDRFVRNNAGRRLSRPTSSSTTCFLSPIPTVVRARGRPPLPPLHSLPRPCSPKEPPALPWRAAGPRPAMLKLPAARLAQNRGGDYIRRARYVSIRVLPLHLA
jgi:hypothetical protein